MVILKTLPNIEAPFSFVHKVLTKHGFHVARQEDQVLYRTLVQDASSEQTYELRIPTVPNQDTDRIKFGQAYFEDKQRVPEAIYRAAQSKLAETADYLKQQQQDSEALEPNDQDHNSMAPTIDDIVKLGKEMEQLSNNRNSAQDPWQ
jgi:hypothetical protein